MVLQTIFYQDSHCIILAVLVTEKITFSNPYRHFTPICHKNQTYSTSFFLHISTAKCLLCFKLCDLRFLLKQKRRHFCHFFKMFSKIQFYLQQNVIHSVSRHSHALLPPMPIWSAAHLQLSLCTQLHALQSTSIFLSGCSIAFLAESPFLSRKLEQQVFCAFVASFPSIIISPLQQYLSSL